MHPTILSGDVTPSSLNIPSPHLVSSSLNESKDKNLLTTDITDDGNTSDSSINDNHESSDDRETPPLKCEKGQK